MSTTETMNILITGVKGHHITMIRTMRTNTFVDLHWIVIATVPASPLPFTCGITFQTFLSTLAADNTILQTCFLSKYRTYSPPLVCVVLNLGLVRVSSSTLILTTVKCRIAFSGNVSQFCSAERTGLRELHADALP
jgi:hypothetical protein